MDSLLQLLQLIIVLCAVGAALFAGQFSRMHKVKFNDASKFMLSVSVILVIGADLLNLIPTLQLSNFGLVSFFGGSEISYVIGYGIVELIIYTGVAYLFSYHFLNKEKLLDVYEWSEEFAENWKQGQSTSTGRQPEHEQDEASQLQRLYILRQKGVITEGEFDAKKKKILGL